MPADGFSKAKANSKPLQEFMATLEASEWLEIEVRGRETKRTDSSSLFRYWNEFLSNTSASTLRERKRGSQISYPVRIVPKAA